MSNLNFFVIDNLDYHENSVNDILIIRYDFDKHQRLISCSDDCKIFVYNLYSDELEEEIDNEETEVTCLQFNHHFQYLLYSDSKGYIYIYKLKKDEFHFRKRFFLSSSKKAGISKFLLHGEFDRSILSVIEESGCVTFCDNFKKKRKSMKKKVIYKHSYKWISSCLIRLETNRNVFIVGGNKPYQLVKINVEEMKITKFEEKHSLKISSICSYIRADDKNEVILCSSVDFCLSIWDVDGNCLQWIPFGTGEKGEGFITSFFYISSTLFLLGTSNGMIYTFLEKEKKMILDLSINQQFPLHYSSILKIHAIEASDFVSLKMGTCSRDGKISLCRVSGVGDVDVEERIRLLKTFVKTEHWNRFYIQKKQQKQEEVKEEEEEKQKRIWIFKSFLSN